MRLRLHDLGKDVGIRVIDLYFVRERNSKRETKLINMLLFIKTTLWKVSEMPLCEMRLIIIAFFFYSVVIWKGSREIGACK